MAIRYYFIIQGKLTKTEVKHMCGKISEEPIRLKDIYVLKDSRQDSFLDFISEIPPEVIRRREPTTTFRTYIPDRDVCLVSFKEDYDAMTFKLAIGNGFDGLDYGPNKTKSTWASKTLSKHELIVDFKADDKRVETLGLFNWRDMKNRGAPGFENMVTLREEIWRDK